MYTVLSIILIVFAVLQIILFFKVWAMTNDVKEMAKKMECKFEPVDYIRKALIKGDKDKAVELLTDALAQELIVFAAGENRDKYSSVDEIKEKYINLFKCIGVDRLPIVNIENSDDIKKIMPYFNI